MNTKMKELADRGDLESLKYIFYDSLDVDPTFVRYEEEYNYCKSIPGLLEAHVELTPFTENQDEWTEAYWASLKTDLLENFSDQRMSHMREVAKVFLAEKIQRILKERAATSTQVAQPERISAANRQPEAKMAQSNKQMPLSKTPKQSRPAERDSKQKTENKGQEINRRGEKGYTKAVSPTVKPILSETGSRSVNTPTAKTQRETETIQKSIKTTMGPKEAAQARDLEAKRRQHQENEKLAARKREEERAARREQLAHTQQQSSGHAKKGSSKNVLGIVVAVVAIVAIIVVLLQQTVVTLPQQ